MFILKKLIGTLLMPLPFTLMLLLSGLGLLWFSQQGSKKQLLGRLLVSFGTGILLLASLPHTSLVLNRSLEREYAPLYSAPTDLDYVVVLGGGHRSDPYLPRREQLYSSPYRRTMEGISLMRANPDATLLVSGYGGSDPVSSAKLASVVALEAGIREDRIRLFESARDTAEEAELIAPVIKGYKSVLVTSASHMPRALRLFQEQGAEPIPAPTDFMGKEPQGSLFLFQQLPAAGELSVVTAAWHEILGSLWQKIRN